jgi:hypothetical protein
LVKTARSSAERASRPETGSHPDAPLFAAITAGLIEGDDIVVEEIDGKLYEVLRAGRRVPLFD